MCKALAQLHRLIGSFTFKILSVARKIMLSLHIELSKECRKEMQYYKILAKEVEKRIDLLKPYVTESDTDSNDDKTDAPDLTPDYDQIYQTTKHDAEDAYDLDIAIANDKSFNPESNNSVSSNLSKKLGGNPDLCHLENFEIDLSVNFNDCGKGLLEKVRNPQPSDPPERDYNNAPQKNMLYKVKKELLTDIENSYHSTKSHVDGVLNFKFDIENVLNQSDPLPDMPMEDGPSSLSAKSFTGSLNNIHRESMKETCPLLRQSSYTVLNPSPQLIAHLKVQSLSTGVDVTSISMSESLSNITGNKKRRSWDLESAKVKWSSMALELKQKTITNPKPHTNKNISRTPAKKTRPISPARTRSVAPDRSRRGSLPNKNQPKSEPIQRVNRTSPVRNIPSNRTMVKEPINKPNQKTHSPKQSPKQSPKHSPNQSPTKQHSPINKSPHLPPQRLTPNKQTLNQIISNSEDPAERVRELYEKIQNQQLQQMNTLIEKQKKEQILLHQVFEEQNSILYKQLKTICPKSPVEVRKAWGDKLQDAPDRGPVSLSQLINSKPEPRAQSPATSTLVDTHNNLNKCDSVLRRSRDITASMKRQQPKRNSPPPSRSDRSPTDGSRTRTHSPNIRQTSISRRLNYETSPSPISDFGATSASREFEPIMTDRTNDTMAGLNVSFPTDSDDCPATYNSGFSQCGKEITMIHCPQPPVVAPRSSTDSAIRVMEQSIHDSMNTMAMRNQSASYNCPTPQQITAACYALHDTFITSSPAERCAQIAVDRERRRQKPVPRHYRHKSDI